MNEMDCPGWAAQMTTGLAGVNASLQLDWINPALADCLALGPRSAVGQPLKRWLDEAALDQAARALAEQRPLQWRDMGLADASGREFRADIALQPFDDGLLLEVHALAEPLSMPSPLSSTLRGFAHEVKNPLAGLRGAAQLLKRRVNSGDLQALAQLIIDEADRLAALADRLLHHNGATHLGPINIHHVLERLGQLLQAESTAPQLRHDYDPSVPDLYGDADQLQQVLLNLARNALEAGARTLTFRTRIEHSLRLGKRVHRMALRVDVLDDGPGVPVALRDALFQPLVSGRADGTGLGLALSREIAVEHGGELRYMSGAAQTTFSMYLPLERLT